MVRKDAGGRLRFIRLDSRDGSSWIRWGIRWTLTNNIRPRFRIVGIYRVDVEITLASTDQRGKISIQLRFKLVKTNRFARSLIFLCFSSSSEDSGTFIDKYNVRRTCILRSFCVKTGLQLSMREYAFDTSSKSTRTTAECFTEDDVLNIFPLIKQVPPKVSPVVFDHCCWQCRTFSLSLRSPAMPISSLRRANRRSNRVYCVKASNWFPKHTICWTTSTDRCIPRSACVYDC